MATSFNPNVLFEMRRTLAEFWAKLDLKNLKQHESVEEYINKFNSFTIDPLLTEDFKIYWFMKGLTAEISSVIEIMCPSTILEAMYYARMQEKLLEVNRWVNQDQHEVMNACTGLYLPCVLASEENCPENTSEEEEEVITTSDNLSAYFHETAGTSTHVLNFEAKYMEMLKMITDKKEKQVPLADRTTPSDGSEATSRSQWFNGGVNSHGNAQVSGAVCRSVQILGSISAAGMASQDSNVPNLVYGILPPQMAPSSSAISGSLPVIGVAHPFGVAPIQRCGHFQIPAVTFSSAMPGISPLQQLSTNNGNYSNSIPFTEHNMLDFDRAAIGPIQFIGSVPSSSVLHFHLRCLDSITYHRYQHTMRATMAEIQVWNHNYKAKQILNGGGSNIVISGGSTCSNVSNHEEVSYNSSADHCLYEESACFRQRLLCYIEAKSSSKQADIPSKGKVNAYACFLSPETSQERILECYECSRPQNSTHTLKGAQDKKVNEIKGDFPEGYSQQNEGGSTMEDCTLFESLPQIVLKNIFGNECPALAQGSFIGLPQSPSGWIATKR